MIDASSAGAGDGDGQSSVKLAKMQISFVAHYLDIITWLLPGRADTEESRLIGRACNEPSRCLKLYNQGEGPY